MLMVVALKSDDRIKCLAFVFEILLRLKNQTLLINVQSTEQGGALTHRHFIEGFLNLLDASLLLFRHFDISFLFEFTFFQLISACLADLDFSINFHSLIAAFHHYITMSFLSYNKKPFPTYII